MWMYPPAQLHEEIAAGTIDPVAMIGLGPDAGCFAMLDTNPPRIYHGSIPYPEFRLSGDVFKYAQFFYNGLPIFVNGQGNYFFRSYDGRFKLTVADVFDETHSIDTTYSVSTIWDPRIQSGTRLTDVIDLCDSSIGYLVGDLSQFPSHGQTFTLSAVNVEWPTPGYGDSAELSTYKPVWTKTGDVQLIPNSSPAYRDLSAAIGLYTCQGENDKTIGNALWENARGRIDTDYIPAEELPDWIVVEKNITTLLIVRDYDRNIVFPAAYDDQLRKWVSVDENIITNPNHFRVNPGQTAHVSYMLSGESTWENFDVAFRGYTIQASKHRSKWMLQTDTPWYRDNSYTGD